MFHSTEEYEEELSKLKERLRLQIKRASNEIFVECYNGLYDVWGHVLNVSKHEFMTFTKGHNEQWCDKISCLFETGFDSVLKVIFSKNKDIYEETLDFYIDDFFKKQYIFEEEWYVCSKCQLQTEFLNDECNTCDDCTPAHLK